MKETYSLADAWNALRQRRRVVLIGVIAGALLGALGALLRPKMYQAEVNFFLKNPLYADRSYLYNTDARMIDYFATAEDVDRLRSLVWSDTVQNQIIREFHLFQAFRADSTVPADRKAVKKRFSRNITVLRSADNVVQLWYHDEDEARTSAVAARTVDLLEQSLRSYYNEMRRSIYTTLAAKVREEDSTLVRLTDSLARLRERYGIYDILSPSRYNIMLSAIKPSGKADFARGLEEVQNIESVKDELVTARARKTTLMNQYVTGTRMNELPLTRILSVEKPPLKAEGTGLLTTALGCAVLAGFCSVLYVLSLAYRRYSNA